MERKRARERTSEREKERERERNEDRGEWKKERARRYLIFSSAALHIAKTGFTESTEYEGNR